MAHWKTLSHNGVAVPDSYSPEGLHVMVKGKPVSLSPLAEEMAYHLAKKKDTPYVKDPVFTLNFMKDFDRELPAQLRGAKFDDVDFSEFFQKVEREKQEKESMSKERKKSLAGDRKLRREALKAKFGYALVDGEKVEIANWLVEPPGLFMGRGSHPFRGRWKPRVAGKDVTLNLGEGAPLPEGEWKEVVNDHDSMWMAKWIDKLTDREKYVWLHESSGIQQSRNKEKYDKALRVGKSLDRIRAAILKGMGSREERDAKIATVCYLIDKLGMRVGDEKDKDEADTVGATTLRVEHVKLGSEIQFDFLGKDSVQWIKRIENPEPALSQNLRKFQAGKKPDTKIFDGISSSMVNRFLSGVIPGTTAKVFRTYHATRIAGSRLKAKDVKDADDLQKRYHAKMANLEAAIWCNHKRTPPKNWEESLKKKQQKLAEYQQKGKDERAKKVEMDIDMAVRTKDYNLNTSLKNYIDPRLYKSWCDHVGLDWTKVYTKSMQRKFAWAATAKWSESEPISVVARSG